MDIIIENPMQHYWELYNDTPSYYECISADNRLNLVYHKCKQEVHRLAIEIPDKHYVTDSQIYYFIGQQDAYEKIIDIIEVNLDKLIE